MVDKLNNPEVWKKSYLIEIAYTDKDAEVFTFSLPPEGSEITLSQRVSETKTFGGLFVDDYGIDVAKIHLSGTTGNSCFKKIFRDKASDIWLDGKEEIYYLRDRIIRYKDQGRSKDCPPLYLYNLSTNNTETTQMSTSCVDAWEVILKDFKITQNKDKPFVYNYSIDFTGVRLLGTSRIPTRPEPGLGESSFNLLNLLQKGLNELARFYEISQKVKNAVQDARSAVNWFTAEVERYVAMLTGSLENYIQVGVDAVGMATDVYGSLKRFTMAPADSALRMINSLAVLRESVEAVITDIKTLPEQWGEQYGEHGTVAEAGHREIEAYKRYFEELMQDTENTANDLNTQTVSGTNPDIYQNPPDQGSDFGLPGDKSGNGGGSGGFPELLIIYGYMRHIANSETTLEALATRYLGDPDKARIIAPLNGITGDDEIQPGDQLKIPVLSKNALHSLNQIFGSVNNRDTLGIDIALKNGMLQIGPNGDFVTQTDQENMAQAIRLRLSESIGNRIRLSTYGIRNVAGIPDAVATAYIVTSIKDTILQDPRVERIEDVRFRGAGDDIYIEFIYYTYDGVRREHRGGL